MIEDHVNERVREVRMSGRSLLSMLDDDLEAAWVAHSAASEGKRATVRGRVRGLAQAIATVRSPFSRSDLGADSRAWAEEIRRTEDEALRRCRAKGLV